jgi:hypothetical protein
VRYLSQHAGSILGMGRADKGVGPLRAFVSGTCLVQELDTLLPTFFHGQVELSAWQGSFDLVGEDFFDPTGKLVPEFTTSPLLSDG